MNEEHKLWLEEHGFRPYEPVARCWRKGCVYVNEGHCGSWYASLDRADGEKEMGDSPRDSIVMLRNRHIRQLGDLLDASDMSETDYCNKRDSALLRDILPRVDDDGCGCWLCGG